MGFMFTEWHSRPRLPGQVRSIVHGQDVMVVQWGSCLQSGIVGHACQVRLQFTVMHSGLRD